MEKHPETAMAEQTLQKSKSNLQDARSELFPKLDLIFDTHYTKVIETSDPTSYTVDWPPAGKSYTISPTKDSPDYQSNLSLGVKEKLFAGGSIRQAIKGAKAQISAAENQKLVKQRAIALSAVKAYWELKRAQKTVEIDQNKVKHAESILKVAKERYEKGVIPELEKEEAEVDVANSIGDVLQAETEQNIAQENLLKEIGIINKIPFPLILSDEPQYDFPPADEETGAQAAITQALQARPEIMAVKAHISNDLADIKTAKASYYPQLDLVGQYNWIGYSSDSLDDSWSDLDEDYWLVGLKANLNLFEGLATKSKINQAKSELSLSMLDMENQKQTIIQEVRRAYHSLRGAARRVPLAQKNIALAKKNLAAAKKQFELGTAVINHVAEYNLSLAEVKKRYIMALIDFEIAKAELTWAKGGKLF